MHRNLGILLAVAVLCSAGCRTLTSPTVDVESAAQRLAVVDSPPSSEPTDAPELRNVRMSLHGDQLVVHANLERNGWTIQDLASPPAANEPGSWKMFVTVGMVVGPDHLIQENITLNPASGIGTVRVTNGQVRIEADMARLFARHFTDEEWRPFARSLAYYADIHAWHESWGGTIEEQHRSSESLGELVLDGAPSASADDPVAVAR